MKSRFASECGAVLIHVAVALLGLIAFATFVADYGIMWVSRGQAQTAADAGALSGALALAFEGSADFAGAKEKARAVAIANKVFGAAPDVQLSDVTFPPCPPNTPGLPDTCVKVDAFRNQARGNPLPMFFGKIVGLSEQGVRATATAQVFTGDSTDCLKPWAVIDRWKEYGEPWTPQATYDKYSDGKGQNPPQEDDEYIPPGKNADGTPNPGTGFVLPEDEGRQFAVKTGSPGISSGWFMAIQLPRADGHWNGGNVYGENILTCGGLTYSIAQPGVACPAVIDQGNAAEWAAKGCYLVKPGNTVGPTNGIEDIIAKDDKAKWLGGKIVDSIFSPPTDSPRVVPIGVIDPAEYLSKDPSGKSDGVVRMVNIYGFFIEGMGDILPDGTMVLSKSGKDVIGRILTLPSTGTKSSPLPSTSSFLRTVILVR